MKLIKKRAIRRYGLLVLSSWVAGCATVPAAPEPLAELGAPVALVSATPTYATPADIPPERPLKKRKPPKPVVASKVAMAKPAPASRFARLSLGMPRHEVERLIGLPGDVRTVRAPANKNASAPADLPILVEETFYRQEGSLVFGKGGTVLTRINVNTGASGIR